MRPINVCKLCGKLKPLCHSHIIPEFCYKAIYDSKHRMNSVSLANLDKPTYKQKGIREYLLCDDCEKHLNENFEKPFKVFWYDNIAVPSPVKTDVIQITGFNYTQFKLFLLSVFWRASVSTHEIFNCVALGPYQDKIRDMLLEIDPKPEHIFPIIAQVAIGDDHEVRHIFVMTPERAKLNNTHIYAMLFGGCEWCLAVTDHRVSLMNTLKSRVPRENGTMRLSVRHYSKTNTIIRWRRSVRDGL